MFLQGAVNINNYGNHGKGKKKLNVKGSRVDPNAGSRERVREENPAKGEKTL